jgi:hypothetical protein
MGVCLGACSVTQ